MKELHINATSNEITIANIKEPPFNIT